MNKNDLSFRTYVNEVAEANVKKNIRSAAIFGYVLAGINLIFAFIFSIFILLDAMLIGGLTFGFHYGKSRVCSLLLFIYSICNCFYAVLKTGRISGYLIIVMAFYALKEFYKANKEYKAYIKNTHTIVGESVNKQ